MHSPWESLHFHRDADLVVVGGGIVGLFTALFHKRAFPHHHVLVLERGPFPSGASVRNAGFACFGSPGELLADVAAEGTDAVLARVEERWKGLLELRGELGDAHLGFEAVGGHEVLRGEDPEHGRIVAGLDALNEALRPIFGTTAFLWDDAAIARNGLGDVGHVVRTDLEGTLDSGALMASLLRKAVAEGVLFRPGAHVTELEEGPAGVRLALRAGGGVGAARVVVATNGYARDLLPALDVRPARGQVLLTGPVPGLKLKGAFHADQGFFYFRDLGGAVLIGGGRNLDISGETTSEDGVTPLVQEALERMLRDIVLPGVPFTVERRWSGVMGFRAQGKAPLVERIGERTVAAVGLSGMGLAIGIRVARRAVALVAE